MYLSILIHNLMSNTFSIDAIMKLTDFPHLFVFYYDAMQKTRDYDNKDFKVCGFWYQELWNSDNSTSPRIIPAF